MNLDIRYEIHRRRERLAPWFVSKLPNWVIYHATIRAGVHATTGQYGNTIVPEVTYMDVLKRWPHKDNQGH